MHSYLNTLPVRGLLAIAFAASLWAGREFPGKPGEAVIPNELIVKLKPQANIAAVLAAVAPGALPDFHAISNVHRLTVPAASAAAISAAIEAVCSVLTQAGSAVGVVVPVVVVPAVAETVVGAATVGAVTAELTAENLP